MTKEQIAYLERESERARAERANRRMFILCIIFAVMLMISVSYIVYLKTQYQQVTETQEVEQIADGQGNNQFVGGDYYGDPEG